MKKIFSLLIAALLFALHTQAQINHYSFSTSTPGAYTPVSGGTIVYSGAAQGVDTLSLENYAFAAGDTLINEAAEVTGFPIGFNFKLGETEFTSFAVSPQGFIYLGNTTFTVDAVDAGGSPAVFADEARFTEGATNLIGFSRVTGTATASYSIPATEISYLLSGTTDNQVLTVQFTKLTIQFGSVGAFQDVDLQLKLYEVDNHVEFVFNNFTPTSNVSGNMTWCEIGLKGNVAGNTKYVNASQNSNWSNATSGTTGTATLRLTTVPDGLTFTFTPPPTCVTPTQKASDLALTATSTSITGTFTKSTDADKQIVLLGKKISLIGNTHKPTDNTVYSVGDSIADKYEVVYVGDASTFTVNNLEGSTNYTVLVYSFNDACLYGPKYFATSQGRLSGNVTTLPAAPELSVVGNGFDAVRILATANAEGHDVIVAQNIGQWATDNNNNQLNDGVFGIPTADLNVGDAITGGGIVIYKGAASEITVPDLTPNTLINFAAWSIDSDDAISSTVTKANVLTWGTSPYLVNFGQFKPYAVPEGWEEGGDEAFDLVASSTTKRGDYLRAYNVSAYSYNSITTQYIKLAEGESRLVLEGSLTHTTGVRPYATSNYTEWADDDSIVVLLQKFGETEFTPVATFAKADSTSFGGTYSLVIPISGFENDTVKIKLELKLGAVTNGTLTYTITKYLVEEIPQYEAPINLAVDSIYTSYAKVTWERNTEGTETEWQIRWRKEGSQTWSEPVTTDTTLYYFTNLPTDATVEVQVRAKIDQEFSPWTFSLTFDTGYGIPYFQNFDGYASATAFATGESWTITDATNHTLLNSAGTLNLAFRKNPAPSSAFALSPQLDFGDGSLNYTLKFKIAANGLSAVPTDTVFAVIAEYDGTDYIYQVLDTLTSESETVFYELPVSGVQGIKQAGFYIAENVRSTSATLSIDSFSVEFTCPPLASNVSAVKIIHSEATIAWEGANDNWLIFLRKAGETEKEYVEFSGNEKKFTDLDLGTTYEFGITNSCSEGDTAKLNIFTFTTLSEAPVCPVPTNLQATAITETSALLSWDADDENLSWDLRYREGSATTWIDSVGLTSTSLLLQDLNANTVYLWRVKAYCEANVESEYAAQSDFSTTGTDISSVSGNVLKVFASKGIINILNPENVYIESIQIFDITGKQIQNFEVKGADNVLVPTGTTPRHLLVRINGTNNSETFKILTK